MNLYRCGKNVKELQETCMKSVLLKDSNKTGKPEFGSAKEMVQQIKVSTFNLNS